LLTKFEKSYKGHIMVGGGGVSLLGTNQFNVMFYCTPSLTLHQPNPSGLLSLQFCLFVCNVYCETVFSLITCGQERGAAAGIRPDIIRGSWFE
jgi:hypothetical protein